MKSTRTRGQTKTKMVADYNRRQRLARLAGRMGTFKDMLTRADLQKMRGTA